MEISLLKPSSILDLDQVDEVIHFDIYENQNQFLYTKYRYLTTDFRGNPIYESDK